MKLADQICNQKWVRNCDGPEQFTSILRNVIACSGRVDGRHRTVRRCLSGDEDFGDPKVSETRS
jgi:hypothetical protein